MAPTGVYANCQASWLVERLPWFFKRMLAGSFSAGQVLSQCQGAGSFSDAWFWPESRPGALTIFVPVHSRADGKGITKDTFRSLLGSGPASPMNGPCSRERSRRGFFVLGWQGPWPSKVETVFVQLQAIKQVINGCAHGRKRDGRRQVFSGRAGISGISRLGWNNVICIDAVDRL